MKERRGPGYVAHLEQVNKALEAKLDEGRCNADSSCSSSRRHGRTASSSYARDNHNRRTCLRLLTPTFTLSDCALIFPEGRPSAPDAGLIETIGCLSNDMNFVNHATSCSYGNSSGIEVLRRMRLYLGAAAGATASDQQNSTAQPVSALDRPLPLEGRSASASLNLFSPSQEGLLRRTDVAFYKSLCVRSFVDRSFIERSIARRNSATSFRLPVTEHDHVAPIYAIAALGEILMRDDSEAWPRNDANHLRGYVILTIRDSNSLGCS